MVISGSGSLPGGDYNEEVRISGSGVINGNVSCTEFSISGSGEVQGNLHCTGNAKISGSGSVKGNLEAGETSISGSGTVSGNVKGNRCNVSGMFEAGGIMVNELNVSGKIKAGGDISAENAVIHGMIEAAGLINAEKFDTAFDYDSSAEAIGGSFIHIRRKGLAAGFFSRLFKGNKGGCFTVSGSIEGDVIDIEYTTAESVVGREVIIGPGCKIGKLTYIEKINISPEAEVGSVEKAEV